MSALLAHPHGGQLVLTRGPSPAEARLVIVLVHGRGASAEDILSLSDEIGLDDIAYLAPQATGRTWYPSSFLAPLSQNEPQLGSALRVIGELIAQVEHDGVAAERIGVLGFSQGACLSLEFAARHARRHAAVIALSGGLIGPPDTPRNYGGSLAGTPVFLGCSDVDPHVPLERVRESADVFRRLGAAVEERIYRGMGHTVNRDELDAATSLLGA